MLSELEAEAGRNSELARAHQAREQQIEVVLEQTRQACFERDRRMAYLEAELDLSRTEAESRERGLAALGAELEALRVSSRGQATRIRLEALREAADVSARARRLDGAKEASVDRLFRSLGRAIDRIGREHGGEVGETTPTDKAAESQLAAGAAERNPGPADGEGRVRVDVGPFHDFSQLVSFEDAANAIGATGEISIRRFSEGRADIDVELTEPADLLRELEQRCDLEFVVRARNADQLVLDLGE